MHANTENTPNVPALITELIERLTPEAGAIQLLSLTSAHYNKIVRAAEHENFTTTGPHGEYWIRGGCYSLMTLLSESIIYARNPMQRSNLFLAIKALLTAKGTTLEHWQQTLSPGLLWSYVHVRIKLQHIKYYGPQGNLKASLKPLGSAQLNSLATLTQSILNILPQVTDEMKKHVVSFIFDRFPFTLSTPYFSQFIQDGFFANQKEVEKHLEEIQVLPNINSAIDDFLTSPFSTTQSTGDLTKFRQWATSMTNWLKRYYPQNERNSSKIDALDCIWQCDPERINPLTLKFLHLPLFSSCLTDTIRAKLKDVSTMILLQLLKQVNTPLPSTHVDLSLLPKIREDLTNYTEYSNLYIVGIGRTFDLNVKWQNNHDLGRKYLYVSLAFDAPLSNNKQIKILSNLFSQGVAQNFIDSMTLQALHKILPDAASGKFPQETANDLIKKLQAFKTDGLPPGSHYSLTLQHIGDLALVPNEPFRSLFLDTLVILFSQDNDFCSRTITSRDIRTDIERTNLLAFIGFAAKKYPDHAAAWYFQHLYLIHQETEKTSMLSTIQSSNYHPTAQQIDKILRDLPAQTKRDISFNCLTTLLRHLPQPEQFTPSFEPTTLAAWSGGYTVAQAARARHSGYGREACLTYCLYFRWLNVPATTKRQWASAEAGIFKELGEAGTHNLPKLISCVAISTEAIQSGTLSAKSIAMIWRIPAITIQRYCERLRATPDKLAGLIDALSDYFLALSQIPPGQHLKDAKAAFSAIISAATLKCSAGRLMQVTSIFVKLIQRCLSNTQVSWHPDLQLWFVHILSDTLKDPAAAATLLLSIPPKSIQNRPQPLRELYTSLSLASTAPAPKRQTLIQLLKPVLKQQLIEHLSTSPVITIETPAVSIEFQSFQLLTNPSMTDTPEALLDVLDSIPLTTLLPRRDLSFALDHQRTKNLTNTLITWLTTTHDQSLEKFQSTPLCHNKIKEALFNTLKPWLEEVGSLFSTASIMKYANVLHLTLGQPLSAASFLTQILTSSTIDWIYGYELCETICAALNNYLGEEIDSDTRQVILQKMTAIRSRAATLKTRTQASSSNLNNNTLSHLENNHTNGFFPSLGIESIPGPENPVTFTSSDEVTRRMLDSMSANEKATFINRAFGGDYVRAKLNTNDPSPLAVPAASDEGTTTNPLKRKHEQASSSTSPNDANLPTTTNNPAGDDRGAAPKKPKLTATPSSVFGKTASPAPTTENLMTMDVAPNSSQHNTP